MLDWVNWDHWGWNGVLSLASDPVNPSRVYAAAGMYLNSWDPNNRAILRSAGDYVPDPTDPNQYLTFNQGVVWVAFDKASGTAGGTTPGIYVGRGGPAEAPCTAPPTAGPPGAGRRAAKMLSRLGGARSTGPAAAHRS